MDPTRAIKDFVQIQHFALLQLIPKLDIDRDARQQVVWLRPHCGIARRARAFEITMPPRKKKLKVAGASPGTPDTAVAASMSAVTPFQRDVSLTVELMYSLRHGVDGARKRPLEDTMMEVDSSSGMPKPDSDGIYPFPLCSGGTFMEMAQRAQTCEGAVETGWLAKESAEFCFAAGLLESADPMEFLSEFVVAKVPHMLNLWWWFVFK